MAPPKLYMVDLSPPVRSVLLTTKALGITLDYRVLDISDLEQFNTDFFMPKLKHTVPMLVDNGYIIWDSHAIIAYLIGKYGNDDSLYPKDETKREVINQTLQFDSQVIYSNIRRIIRSMIDYGVNNVSMDEQNELLKVYCFLEELIGNQQWMAGDKLTIADLSLIPSVTSADILVPIDKLKYPKLCAWIKRLQTLPYYEEANQTGLNNFKNLIKTISV